MSSGFITESEALEARRQRQEEWDKVRTEDQPKEAPEEEYDTRPLYHRLEEQRLKKEAEYEEAHKLKNMIRGLDDDEIGFLDLVERSKAKAAQQISLDEQKEMQEYRERVSHLAESEELQRMRAQLAAPRPPPPRPKQRNSLQGVVVRKRKASEVEGDKDNGPSDAKLNGVVKGTSSSGGAVTSQPALRCVGVLPGLPGLRHYHSGNSDTSDSDSDNSSDSESDNGCCKLDLLGRKSENHDKHKDGNKS